MRFPAGASTLLALLTLLTSLSGCFQDDPAPPQEIPEEPAPIMDIAPLNRTLHLPSCARSVHSYTTAMTFFEGVQPAGFEVAGGSRVPGTTQLSVFVDACAEAHDRHQENATTSWTESIAVILAIPVNPPADERDVNLTRNYVPISIAVQGAKMLERYHEWGFTMATNSSIVRTISSDGPAYRIDMSWADGAGTFTSRAAGQVGGGVTGGSGYRMWVAQDGEAVGSVLFEYGAGQRIGTSGVDMQFNGDGVVPPVSAGTATDSEGSEVFMRYLPRGTPLPPMLAGTN